MEAGGIGKRRDKLGEGGWRDRGMWRERGKGR